MHFTRTRHFGPERGRFARIRRTSSLWIRPRANGGFTLTEILVVTAIISVLGMVAVPTVARISRRSKTAAIVNDFRVFGAAFDTYAQERGRWPNESATGATPSGMTTYLKVTAWRRISPMGGKYDWERNQLHMGVRYTAAIAIKAAAGAPLPLDTNQLLDIDQFMDDGNLATGSFRIGTGFCPLYVIQP